MSKNDREIPKSHSMCHSEGRKTAKISSVGDFIEAKILRGVYPESRVEILRRAQNDFLRNQIVSRETFFSSIFFFNVLETKESSYSITY